MFDYLSLMFVLILTLLTFLWVVRLKDSEDRLYYGIIAFFVFVYSGIGGTLKSVPDEYIYYYVFYIIVLSITLYFSKPAVGKKIKVNDNKLSRFIEKYALSIITIYIMLHIVELCYPNFLLYRLINPPMPNVLSQLANKYQVVNEQTSFSQVIYYIKELLTPFYFLALYKYRENFKSLLIFVFIILYINYCKEAYIGRSTLFVYLTLFSVVVYKYIPKYRKMLIISLLIFIPLLLVFFVNYSMLRIGGVSEEYDVASAFETLLYQEASYPEHFIYYVNKTTYYISEYLIWLLTLPLPGLFKTSDFYFNTLFSENILGVQSSEKGFFILLPGVVGEAYYVFGKNLFWLHAVFYGLLIGRVRYFLKSSNSFIFLSIYVTLILSYFIARGGTFSGYPFVLKHLIVFYLFIVIYGKYKIKRQ